jgi:coatomer subunit alpha
MSRVLPVAVVTLRQIRQDLSEGFRAVSGNRLADAQTTFRNTLQTLLFVVVTSNDEAKEVSCFWNLY